MRVPEQKVKGRGTLTEREKLSQKAYEHNFHDLVTLDHDDPDKLDEDESRSPSDPNVDKGN